MNPVFIYRMNRTNTLAVSWQAGDTEMQMELTETPGGFIREGRQAQLNGHKPDDHIYKPELISHAQAEEYYGLMSWLKENEGKNVS